MILFYSKILFIKYYLNMFNLKRRLITNVNIKKQFINIKKFNFANENNRKETPEQFAAQKEGFKKLMDFMLGREKYSWDDYFQQVKVKYSLIFLNIL